MPGQRVGQGDSFTVVAEVPPDGKLGGCVPDRTREALSQVGW
jgi:hypothetical protein